MEFNEALEHISIISAGFAAIFWFASAIVRITYKPTVNKDDLNNSATTSSDIDFIKGIKTQSLLSAIAALLTGVSALSLGLLHWYHLHI